jgi:hypothetical protein
LVCCTNKNLATLLGIANTSTLCTYMMAFEYVQSNSFTSVGGPFISPASQAVDNQGNRIGRIFDNLVSVFYFCHFLKNAKVARSFWLLLTWYK